LVTLFKFSLPIRPYQNGLLRLEFDGGVGSDTDNIGMARKYSLDLDEEERSEDFLALKLDGGCQGEDIEGSVLDSSGTPGAAGHALSGVDVLGLSPLNYSGGDFTIDLHHGYVSSKIKGAVDLGLVRNTLFTWDFRARKSWPFGISRLHWYQSYGIPA
jgi:hypothetical protein